MPTMTVPSAAMRRFKLAAAAAAESPPLEPALLRPATTHGACRSSFLVSLAGKAGKRRRAGTTTADEVHAPPTPPSAASSAADGNMTAVTWTGARVLVRTPVTAPSGLVREFMLTAVVVSAVDGEGYVEVVYDCRWPPEDPSAAVRVVVEQIIVMNPQHNPR